VKGSHPADTVLLEPVGPREEFTRRISESDRMEPRQADVIDRKVDADGNRGGHRPTLGPRRCVCQPNSTGTRALPQGKEGYSPTLDMNSSPRAAVMVVAKLFSGRR